MLQPGDLVILRARSSELRDVYLVVAVRIREDMYEHSGAQHIFVPTYGAGWYPSRWFERVSER